MHRILSLSVISPLLALLPAQQTQLSGPIEGFTFDAPTGSFRAIVGLPGSAWLGPAILSGFEAGSVAPRKDYGIAFKTGECVVVSNLSAANPVVSAVLRAVATPEGVVWSGDGSRAILFSRSGNWTQTLGGFPDAPSPQDFVDLSFLGGSLSAITADKPGGRIALGMTGDSGGVYLITDGRNPVPLLAGSKPIALAFSDDGSAIYAIDGAIPQLTALHIADLTAQQFSLDGLSDPVAVRSTADTANRQVLYVAGRNDSLLRMYDTSSGQNLKDIPLDFSPSEITDFGRSSFLLAQRTVDRDPVWLFTTTPQQAAYFVPAAPVASGGSQ